MRRLARRKAATMDDATRHDDDRMSHLAGEEQMSPEQAQALERVRQIYHEGSQPLTVARARYDLIRRGVFDS
jgi:hypothetical protein